MDAAGGVPEPLLPPQIALQNPELLGGDPFFVLPGARAHPRDDRPRRRRELRAVRRPARGRLSRSRVADDPFAAHRSHLVDVDVATGHRVLRRRVAKDAPLIRAIRCEPREPAQVESSAQSQYGAIPVGVDAATTRASSSPTSTSSGDVVLYERDADGGRTVLYGHADRRAGGGRDIRAPGIRSAHVTVERRRRCSSCRRSSTTRAARATSTSRSPGEVEPVASRRARARGRRRARAADASRGTTATRAIYNIDGGSWAYDARFDEARGS